MDKNKKQNIDLNGKKYEVHPDGSVRKPKESKDNVEKVDDELKEKGWEIDLDKKDDVTLSGETLGNKKEKKNQKMMTSQSPQIVILMKIMRTKKRKIKKKRKKKRSALRILQIN